MRNSERVESRTTIGRPRRGAAGGLERSAPHPLGALLFLRTLCGCSRAPVTERRARDIIPESEVLALGTNRSRQVLSPSTLIHGEPRHDAVVKPR